MACVTPVWRSPPPLAPQPPLHRSGFYPFRARMAGVKASAEYYGMKGDIHIAVCGVSQHWGFLPHGGIGVHGRSLCVSGPLGLGRRRQWGAASHSNLPGAAAASPSASGPTSRVHCALFNKHSHSCVCRRVAQLPRSRADHVEGFFRGSRAFARRTSLQPYPCFAPQDCSCCFIRTRAS
jgi:hypothetical protein